MWVYVVGLKMTFGLLKHYKGIKGEFMKLGTKQVLLCTVIAGLMQGAQANTAVDLANRESDRLQQLTQERQRYEQEQLLKSLKQPTRIEVSAPEIKTTEAGPCLTINKIDVLDAKLLSESELNQIAKPYQGTCMDTRAIETLMSQVTATYLNKGYATARVYLPEQDLKQGQLLLQAEEGVLTDVALTERAQGTVNLETALGDVKGKPLNLRDLEQAIDQVNRLQSNNLTMNIVPGKNPGESVVVFDNEVSKRWSAYLTYDNKGQPSTGVNQAALGASLDNPFGLNDLISISYNRSVPFKNNRTDSMSTSLMYVVPFAGYNTLNLSASQSEYDTTIETDFNKLLSEGKTVTLSSRIDSTLYRGLTRQLKMNLGLTSKDTESFLEGVKLGVSSRKLSVADLGLSYSDLMLSGLVNVNVGYSKGLSIFNALEDENNLPVDAPKAQFDKMTYGINYMKGFNWLGQNFTFNSNFSGQQAFDTLYGSEQYSIGSLYSVRGFNQNTLSGDHGYAFKNDLTLSKTHGLSGNPVFGRYTLGLDYGRVDNKENSNYTGELSSVSFSSTFSVNNMSMELIMTQPIHQSNFMEKQTADVFFSTTVSF